MAVSTMGEQAGRFHVEDGWLVGLIDIVTNATYLVNYCIPRCIGSRVRNSKPGGDIMIHSNGECAGRLN